jgi:antitoxin (DNA-binding transcriptional repressor) of toxin-antitoxin stability system
VVITRHGQPVVELRPILAATKPIGSDSADWLTKHRVGQRKPKEDAVTAVRKMRDEWER